MAVVNLGIIGCGIAANKLHRPALEKLRDKFRITCVCNHTRPKAEEFAKKVGNVPFVLDYNDLLARPDVDAVDIMLPIHLNYPVTRAALEAGKHVLVEKPLAANLDEAAEMVEFECRYDRVMMVAENFRYHPVYVRLKERIDAGEIGRVHSAFWNNFMYVNSGPYLATQWRLNHKHIGGFVVDGGVHNIAAMRMLFGDITAGRAFTLQNNPAIGKIDCISLQFETEAGVKGVFNNYFTSNGFLESRLIVIGLEGTLTAERDNITLTRHGQPAQIETFDSPDSYYEEFLDFHAAITEKKRPKSTFDEAYKDLEVLACAIHAAEQKASFTLPD